MVNNKSNWYDKKVHKINLGYYYTIDELRAHIYGNRPLETQRVESVLRGYDQKMHKLIWSGDAATGVDAFVDYPSVVDDPAPTRSGSVTWADKIAGAGGSLDVVLDLIDFVKVANLSSQNRFWNAENPGIIAVPLAQYHDITVPLSIANASNISIRDYAIKSIAGLMDIVPVIDLDGVGVGSTDLALGWVPRGELLEVITTMPVTWQPMERRGQRFQFYSDMRFVGPVVRYSPAMYQMHGI
jgi:hypothetical protein